MENYNLALSLIKREASEKTGKLDLGNCGLTYVPNEVYELTHLTALNLCSKYWDFEMESWVESSNKGEENDLYFLGGGLVNLKNLVKLSIGGETTPWQMKELDIIGTLINLTTLNIANCNLYDISFLVQLSALTNIDIRNNEVKDISALGECGQLETLYADGNHITPSKILANLPHLKILSLDKNKLDNIRFVRKCKALQSLSVSRNNITDISPIAGLKHLKQLNAFQNNISKIDVFSYARGLEQLDLGSNQLDNIKDLKYLQQLHTLDISSNSISDFSVLKELPNLRNLSLYQSQRTDFSFLSNLPQLKELYLSSNEISDIGFLADLLQLEKINLNHNNISDISVFTNLHNLKAVYLSENEITDIRPLRHLLEKGIDISLNQYQFNEVINLFNNPLSIPPSEVIAQGRAAIIRYINDLEYSEIQALPTTKNNEIKLVVVGNSTVGKSHFVAYICNDTNTDAISSTHWMEIKETVWKKSTITDTNGRALPLKLNIFDFGGQEYYHDTHHLFFTANTLYILLWETNTNKKGSLQVNLKMPGENKLVSTKIDTHPIAYWLETINYFCNAEDEAAKELDIELQQVNVQSKIRQYMKANVAFPFGKETNDLAPPTNKASIATPILVVQNKVDKDGIQFLQYQSIKERFANVYDFANVSLKTKMRLGMLDNAINEAIQQMTIAQTTLPWSRHIVRKQLNQFSNGKFSMHISELQQLFNQWVKTAFLQEKGYGMANDSELLFNEATTTDHCTYLTQIGELLFFPESENEQLRNIVFYNVNDLTKAIYDIFMVAIKKEGRFTEKDIAQSLGYPQFNEACAHLVDLMLQFKLIFKLPKPKNAFIAPLYLPKQPNNAMQILLQHFEGVLYRYAKKGGFIHKNILLEFFAKFGEFTLSDVVQQRTYYYFWRNGIVLQSRDEVILVEFVIENNNDTTKTNAVINVSSLNAVRSTQSALMHKVNTFLQQLCSQWRFEREISNDGLHFVPFSLVNRFKEQKQAFFSYEGSNFKLVDFASYFKDDEILQPKKVFISYSKEDLSHTKRLLTHLSILQRQGYIESWFDRAMLAGEEWDKRIKEELKQADIVLFLISSDFLATDYIWNTDIKAALENQRTQGQLLVPILLRKCLWEENLSPFGTLQAIPRSTEQANEELTPITLWNNQDSAWTEVAEQIKACVEKLN